MEKKKRGRGRPPKPENAKASKHTWFRATPAQLQRWKRLAKKKNLALATWIKLALDKVAAQEESDV